MALVTGAGGGLGRGLVAEFAAQGWQVCAACHRDNFPAKSATVWPVQLDVTKAVQVNDAIEQMLARWGRVDALVNNAGVTSDCGILKIDGDEWDRVLNVNLKGAFLCSQAVLGPMLKQRDGHIINVSSFAARHGPAGQGGYVAAKAGLIGLTEALAKESGSRNVRVNAVLPGVMPTPMTAKLSAAQLDGLAAANTLKRFNDVDEVARFIVFLAAMENVSGQVFQLDSRIARWT